MELIIGQKEKVSGVIVLEFDKFYDVSCFCLNEQQKLIDDNHMIFYNQLNTPDKSVQLSLTSDKHIFTVDTTQIPVAIKKLSFVITADDKKLKSLNQNITNKTNDFNFSVKSENLNNEKALMFCELYVKDGQWRYNAFAQGFNSGLPAVLKLYGGEEGATQAESVVETKIEPQNKPISLTKISLNKENKKVAISLAKDSSENQMIEVSTKWFDNGDGNDGNDDLDLRVGLLLPDGRMTLIHAGELGSLNKKPYIEHTGDVQVVQGGEGIEKVLVNPKISHLLGGKVGIVFSVYSAVANGVVSVASLRPIMELKTKEHLIQCEFNKSVSSNPTVYTYVIGMIVIDGDKLTVEQLGLTSKMMSEATPWLEWKKDADMPVMEINGPSHFKGQKISKNSTGGLFGGKSNRYVEYVDI